MKPNIVEFVGRYVICRDICLRVLRGLLSQLKCLYVALTRARMNLWITDSSKKAEPMRVSDGVYVHSSVSLDVDVFIHIKASLD